MRLTELLLFLTLIFSSAINAEILDVPIHNESQPPLHIIKDNEFSGIYIDLLKEVLARAQLDYKLVPVPKMRQRIMFERGDFVLSCCANPTWRSRELEKKVQLFSNPFYNTKDVYIFPLNESFKVNGLSDLTDKRIALKRGYGYRGEESFKQQVRLTTEDEIMLFVSLKRADVGIVNEDITRMWINKNNRKVEIGEVHDLASLHIRIHRTRSDLLPKINQAIASMIEDGTVTSIRQKYLDAAVN